jgi:hypothetical protein
VVGAVGGRFYYCVGAPTAIGTEPCAATHRGERFVQQRIGPHHLCLRARLREDVVSVRGCAQGNRRHDRSRAGGGKLGRYYSILFEDPDRIRLQVCFAEIPGFG